MIFLSQQEAFVKFHFKSFILQFYLFMQKKQANNTKYKFAERLFSRTLHIQKDHALDLMNDPKNFSSFFFDKSMYYQWLEDVIYLMSHQNLETFHNHLIPNFNYIFYPYYFHMHILEYFQLFLKIIFIFFFTHIFILAPQTRITNSA